MANELARLQFATTRVYHFFFVPVTIGLAFLRRDSPDRLVQHGQSGLQAGDPLLRDASVDQRRRRRGHRPGPGVRVRDELVDGTRATLARIRDDRHGQQPQTEFPIPGARTASGPQRSCRERHAETAHRCRRRRRRRRRQPGAAGGRPPGSRAASSNGCSRAPSLQAIVAQVVRSDGATQLIDTFFDSGLFDTLVDRLLASDGLWRLIDEVASSPAVRAAVSQQGLGFADQLGDVVRERSRRGDRRLERVRWSPDAARPDGVARQTADARR